MKVTLKMIQPELRFTGLVFRALMRSAIVMKIRVPGARKRSSYIKRADGSELRLLVKRPKELSGPLPGVLWIHGGGYCTGMPEMLYATMARIVCKSCIVVSPDYTLSCEKPYPASFDDCCAALTWMAEHAGELGIRSDQIFVGGESAGGGLAAAVCLWARDTGRVRVACQFPLYPMLDDRADSESMRDNNAPMWSEKQNRQAWALYLKGLTEIPAYAAPAREKNLAGLPPTVTFVGSIEPFLDETSAYVEGLRAAGVPVRFRVFEGCYHSFDAMVPRSHPAKEAKAFFSDALEWAIRECRAEN